MDTRATAPESDTGHPGYAMLRMDRFKLLVPQTELRTLEPVLDIDPEEPISGAVGWLAFGGERWPVHCLSGALDVLDHIPAPRRICVALSDGPRHFCVLCDEFSTVRDETLSLHDVPPCMRSGDSPLVGLALHEGHIGGVSSSGKLARLLGIEKHDGR